MNKALIFFLFALSFSCTTNELEDLRGETFILTGVLQSGEYAKGISVFRLNNDGRTIQNVSDAIVTISLGSELIDLEWGGEFYSASNTSALTAATSNYSITASIGSVELSSEAFVPPIIQVLNSSSSNIIIDENSIGSPAFVIQWDNPDGYEYIMDLKALEDSPTEIPFTVPSGLFSGRFNGPIINPGAVIFDTDFKYYGSHQLIIYRIAKAYSNIWFFNPAGERGYLQAGPDNVHGGRGYFSAVSKKVIDIEISP